MKFEKINDNQVKCFIGAKDLEEKKIKLSELAFGNDKTQQFLREITERANFEVGFEVGNCPLMIEAVPITEKETILYITKVNENGPIQMNKSMGQNPNANANDIQDMGQKSLKGKQDIINRAEEFKKQLLDVVKNAMSMGRPKEENGLKDLNAGRFPSEIPSDADFSDDNFETIELDDNDVDDFELEKEDEGVLDNLFESDSLDKMIEVSALLNGRMDALTTLFYLENAGRYFLRVQYRTDKNSSICYDSVLNDYLHKCHNSEMLTRSLYEHAKVVISEEAVEKLAQLK
ncbi:MAG: adaptor protein MecA [Lachnospiraceae bacterium]|nr:adaptor protein MecA [Lachnospiraceae bacterium]